MAKVVLSDEPPIHELETAVRRISHIIRIRRGNRDNVAVAHYANMQAGIRRVLCDMQREAAREKKGASHAQ